MNFNLLGRLLISGVLFCSFNSVQAYVLQNGFYILNQSKSVLEVSYNSCLFKYVSGKFSTSCESESITLDPSAAKRFSVDSSDNNYVDENNYSYRRIYIYQVINQNSQGLFVFNEDDRDQFNKDYRDESIIPTARSCIANKSHSVILDDYETDKIYCSID